MRAFGGWVVVSAALIVGAVFAGIALSRHHSAPEPTGSPLPAVVRTTTTAYADPSPANFKLGVKIIDKSCYGADVGCNVSFHITVAYTGPRLDPFKTYIVSYEVHGVENGPQGNIFTAKGTNFTGEDLELANTATDRVKLTAIATTVQLN